MSTNTPVRKDWFLLGLLTGMGCSVAKSLLGVAAQRAGIPAKPYASLAGNMMMGARPRLGGLVQGGLSTPEEKLVGAAADTIAGGAFGVALGYVYAKSPPGHEVVKGALGGAALGTLTLAVGRQLRVSGFQNMTVRNAAIHLGLSTFFGGLEGLILGQYSSRLVQQSHPVLVKEVSDQQFETGRLHYGRETEARAHRLWRMPEDRPAHPLDAGLTPTIE